MSSIIKPSMSVSFGDTVRLKDSRIGKVRFIGRATTQKNHIYYGIHLKQDNGNNDGTIHNRRYFKCPRNHGIFIQKSSITEIVKKHTVSASFHYNQQVMVNDINIGTIKYIGWTHFGNDYWYGIQLQSTLQNSQNISDLSNNNHIHLISHSDYNNFRYFDYLPENRSIFVRQTQIKCAKNSEFQRRGVHFQKANPPKIRFKMDEKEQKYDIYNKNENINETLLSMMDSLNIKKSQRKKILSMDNANKLLIIQQWFITPNTQILQKTIKKNVRKKKKSHSLSLLMKKKKSKPKKISTPTPLITGLISPAQSTSNNLDFDGCDISKLKSMKKQKKYMQSKRKKSKSKSLALLGVTAEELDNYTNKKLKKSPKKSVKITRNHIHKSKSLALLGVTAEELDNYRNKQIKKSPKKSVKIKGNHIQKSKSLELKQIDSNPINNRRKRKMIRRRSKNMKHKHVNKSKSTSVLVKECELKNDKKTKGIKKYKKRQRNKSKSDALLIRKSEKSKLKSKKSKKSNKKHKRKDMPMSTTQLKYKRSGSTTILTKKGKRRSVKRSASTKPLKLKNKKMKRKSWSNVDDKLID